MADPPADIWTQAKWKLLEDFQDIAIERMEVIKRKDDEIARIREHSDQCLADKDKEIALLYRRLFDLTEATDRNLTEIARKDQTIVDLRNEIQRLREHCERTHAHCERHARDVRERQARGVDIGEFEPLQKKTREE